MAYIDMRFPPRLAMGIECTQGWSVDVATTRAGWESRNLNWSAMRREYDAAHAIQTEEDFKAARDHFHMARARFHTWPLRDPLDHSCTGAEGVVINDGGLKLHKRYGSGAYAYDHRITRPQTGRVAVSNDGVPGVEGVDWSLDYATGILTFAGAAAEDLAWTGEFIVPCRYDIDKLPAFARDRGATGELLVESVGILIVEVRE